eukprot:Phypoly_transcript_03507.p1 GENE.Phypoly_transcript_03507~~Phypoly_transcript_03507.p1  ORF type:complete len:784 (+),score=120.70 Phypoly_transcript_03507:37-2388(+)
MIITCGGPLLQILPQDNSAGKVGLNVQCWKYSHTAAAFEQINSFFINGFRKSKKTEILIAQFTWDINSGLYAAYLLVRDTRKSGHVYRIIKINSFDVPNESDYEELFKIGKQATGDAQEYWIFGGPTFVIAAHASSKRRAKVLLSLSVISHSENGWSVFDVPIPDVRRFPAFVGCVAVRDEAVGVVRARGENGKSPKWEFCVINLRSSTSRPPSPDLLADDEEMGTAEDQSDSVKLLENLLPHDLNRSDATAVQIWEELGKDETAYNCLLGIRTKTGGKVAECTHEKSLSWFDGIEFPPQQIYILQEHHDRYYIVQDTANKSRVYDSKHNFVSEYEQIETVLIDDFMNVGFDQVALVALNNQSPADISLAEIGNSSTTVRKKSSESEDDTIQSVCRSLRLRAIHAMDHLQNINNTITDKNRLIEHAINMLKEITSPTLAQTGFTRKIPPFIQPDELVPLFEDQETKPILSNDAREHTGPPVRVCGMQHSFGHTGDWDLTISICNYGSVPITCSSCFLVTPDFPIATESSMNNKETISPGKTCSFSLHATLPPITSPTRVDVVFEWSTPNNPHNIHYLTRLDLTPDLKALEIAPPKIASYAINAEITLYSAHTMIPKPKLETILTETLHMHRPSKNGSFREHFTSRDTAQQPFAITADHKSSLVVHLCVHAQHISKILAVLRILADNLPDYVLILPNYATPHTFGVVTEFATAMQNEVDFVLAELAAHISNTKKPQNPTNLSNSTPKNSKNRQKMSNFADEYYRKQQNVDERYYDLLEHFNYLL